MLKLLYGTANSAKLSAMRKHLVDIDLEIYGLNEVNDKLPEIDESGNSPLDNARIKALAYYKAIGTPVFSCDSGLFIENASNELQPGVHVRNIHGKRLNDDEMIDYYSSMATAMGGSMTARYKNAICLVINENEIFEYMGDDIAGERFIITESPHSKRLEGFPLDSLSVHIATGLYYYDLDDYKNRTAMDKGFQNFFRRSLKVD